MNATISELTSFPVKGCQGTTTDALSVGPLGVTGDRAYAVWSDGTLLDQKRHPALATIAPALHGATRDLTLRHVDLGSLEHEMVTRGPKLDTSWILDRFGVIDQGEAAAAWVSEVVGLDARLVVPDEPWRINFPVPQMTAIHDQPKHSFTAASPISIANQASLDHLNGQLDHPVAMDRFRMNVTLEGLDPYVEDHLTLLTGPDVELAMVAQAERCVIVTTDQTSGERPANNLLQALASFRKKPPEEAFASGLKFGSYMTITGTGTLRVGDTLEAVFAD